MLITGLMDMIIAINRVYSNTQNILIDDITSSRVKLDSTINYRANFNISIFARAKFEYKFDSKSELCLLNNQNSYDTKNDGFSSGGEIGVSYNPTTNSNLNFLIRAMGGRVDEVSASLRYIYEW